MATPHTADTAHATGPAATHPAAIGLCLVSHTNVGKTTLARTLLGQDVGEVQDGPHITQMAQAHRLLATPEGDELRLWDTPGFGDSVRLHSRLSQAGQPMGWFLSQVWDRWTDPAFFLSQRAMLAARDEADIVLYLVNASEAPEDCGYLAPELAILAWLGKPVVVVLNQLGHPPEHGTPGQAEQQEQARWATHLSGHTVVKAVLPLDAFARCWVHEGVLLDTLTPWLAPHAQAGYARLVAQWQQRNWQRLERSAHALATELLAAATDVQTGQPGQTGFQAAAQQALAQRVLQCRQHLTRELLALHGLHGQANHPLWQRLDAPAVTAKTPLNAKRMGVLGAITSGAATGLGADAMAGGLTLGLGALVGAVVGGLAFAGAALGANKVRQQERPTLTLAPAALTALLQEALLKYLAIAHFGRGRGDFVHADLPADWQTACATVVADHADAVDGLWADAQRWATQQPHPTAQAPNTPATAHTPPLSPVPNAVQNPPHDLPHSLPPDLLQRLRGLCTEQLLALLQHLYPHTPIQPPEPGQP